MFRAISRLAVLLSLWWLMVPSDVTGSTLRRWEEPGGFGSPPRVDERSRRRALPDTEAFIVQRERRVTPPESRTSRVKRLGVQHCAVEFAVS